MVPTPEGADDADPDRLTGDLAVAGTYPTASDGFDHGLVVLAMGLPYWLVPAECGFQLLVETHATGPVREQLEKFDRESVNWPPAPALLPKRPTEIETPLIWASAVIAVYVAQSRLPGRLEDGGDVDSGAIFGRHQWWRLGTALFLHGDVAHLLSNLLAGIFVFSAVLSTIGRRRGWLLILAASIAGNFIAAAAHYSAPYRSLGASTAVFAGLGILTGRAARFSFRSEHPRPWRGLLVPLATGATLLALYGSGSPQVDVIAHAGGFTAGLAIAFALS